MKRSWFFSTSQKSKCYTVESSEKEFKEFVIENFFIWCQSLLQSSQIMVGAVWRECGC